MNFLNKKGLTRSYMGLILAQCCVGLNVTIGKLLTDFFPVFLLLTMRFAIGLIGTVAVAYMQKLTVKTIHRRFIGLTKKDKLLLFLQAMCGGFLFNILVLYGMKATSAVSTGIITSITPVAILIFSALFLREKITLQSVYTILIVVFGLIVLNVGKGPLVFEKMFLGNLLVLLAVVPEAFFIILSKLIGKKLAESEAVVLINLFNFLIFLPFTLCEFKTWNIGKISFNVYGQLLIYGISGGVLFFLLWHRSVAKVTAHTAALFTAFMPISTVFLAMVLLNEPIHLSDIVGMILIIIAIFVGCKTIDEVKTF